jgi:hypothetical protein
MSIFEFFIFYVPSFINSAQHLLPAGRQVSPTCTSISLFAPALGGFDMLSRIVSAEVCDATEDEQRCERRFK